MVVGAIAYLDKLCYRPNLRCINSNYFKEITRSRMRIFISPVGLIQPSPGAATPALPDAYGEGGGIGIRNLKMQDTAAFPPEALEIERESERVQ